MAVEEGVDQILDLLPHCICQHERFNGAFAHLREVPIYRMLAQLISVRLYEQIQP